MFQATRRRLALWYTAVMAVLLLLFASGFFFYVRGTLIERIDDTLNHVVEVVQRSLVLESSSPGSSPYRINLEASFRNNTETTAAVEDDRIDLEWFTADGNLLWSTWSSPLDLPLTVNTAGATVKISPDHWLRQITASLAINGQVVGYLRVSHPWFEVTKPTQQLLLDLLLGTALIVGLVAFSGWWLSRLAMEPIRQSYQYLKQFTADASHELRNPIALIQTNVQVVLANPALTPEEQQQQWEVVERLTRRLGRLVDDLLFLTRQDSGIVQPQYQSCPLDELLIAVVEEQRAIARTQSISLSLEITDSLDPVAEDEPFSLEGDYDQLLRLFSNLVSNALEYTSPGGKVNVGLQHYNRYHQPWVQVQVQDNGCGIPEEALPHLFERFYRVDPSRSKIAPTTNVGTGLGLAIVQAIVQNHQGQLRVESTLNKGSVFTVLLPQKVSAL